MLHELLAVCAPENDRFLMLCSFKLTSLLRYNREIEVVSTKLLFGIVNSLHKASTKSNWRGAGALSAIWLTPRQDEWGHR